MKTAHTPGPWEFDTEGRWLYASAGSQLPKNYNHGACIVLAEFRPSARVGDLTLIAAAPDLLYYLEALLDCVLPETRLAEDQPVGRIMYHERIKHEARAAIRKAMGEA